MKRQKTKLSIRERIFRWFFAAGDTYRSFMQLFNGICRFFFIISLILFILTFLFYIGFNYSPETSEGIISAFRILFLVMFLSKYLPEILSFRKTKYLSLIFRTLVFLFSLCVFMVNFNLITHQRPIWEHFYGNTPIIAALALITISDLSGFMKLLSTISISPALIFSSSFLVIILTGSGLLLLPRAHTGELAFIDSLFTSVSAVCVTGLTVVNISTAFTTLGQIIILCLIQIGGLGIMTFTGFFSYIFTSSGATVRNRLLLKELFSSDTLNNLFRLLVKIILLTFLTEIAGASLIYSGLDRQMNDRLMISVFHAVSAFCNAGFSTLPDGLYSPSVRFNDTVQISIALLIILGGIGFPVLLGVYSWARHAVIRMVQKIRHNRIPVTPGRKNITTRIVLVTTLILIVAGTGLYYYFENDLSLYGMSTTRKIITAFFGSVSARTAGFNIVAISSWSYPTVFLMIVLMWIGASPGSTGGGIKTTTFALASRSVWKSIRGRDHLMIGTREIGSTTLTRVLAIIFLSMLLITTAFFILMLSEPGRNPVHLLFECVSAFGTVGLSLANTATLSNTGKITIMLLMFVGRVGPLTLFTGFMLAHSKKYYRYPELDIAIN